MSRKCTFPLNNHISWLDHNWIFFLCFLKNDASLGLSIRQPPFDHDALRLGGQWRQSFNDHFAGWRWQSFARDSNDLAADVRRRYWRLLADHQWFGCARPRRLLSYDQRRRGRCKRVHFLCDHDVAGCGWRRWTEITNGQLLNVCEILLCFLCDYL